MTLRARERRRPVVLVVDDDPTMRFLVGEALAPLRPELLEAEDGRAALALLRRRLPDLVLLDVRMPGLDGVAVCEEIRRHPAAADVPVVMMIGLDDVESIRRAYEARATDFVTKPLNWLTLSERVRYLLRANDRLAELRASRARLSAAQRQARMGSWRVELETGELQVSEEFLHVFGLSEAPKLATSPEIWERVHAEDREMLAEALRACLREGTSLHVDPRVVLPDGSERVVHARAEIVRDAQGRAIALDGTAQDVTDRKRAEEQIRYLAYHDSLTGLGNRRLFQERLAMALAQARRNETRVGVLFLDLDQFKRINDTLGHALGDALLQGVADRLVASVRETDIVARRELSGAISRLGGDEFTILFSEIHDVQDLAKVARRVLEALARPFRLGEHQVAIGASIGITAWPDDGSDAETLLRNADTAMYHAKEQGRNNYQFYAQSMNAVALRRLILEGKLRRALEHEEFELHYQPKAALADGAPCGLEALLRWRDPKLGLVLPDDFVPIAEETGLIGRVGEWALHAACRQIAAWRARGLAPLPVSVNLSPHQFRSGQLVEQVRAALAASGVPAAALELEITEGACLHDEARVSAQLEQLRALGVRIALDDFGTGWSALGQLRRLSLDVLKIDRSLVRDVAERADDAALVAAIVTAAKALGLRVVAEGVEREAQREALRAIGCDELQGYLLSPAVPAHEVERFLR